MSLVLFLPFLKKILSMCPSFILSGDRLFLGFFAFISESVWGEEWNSEFVCDSNGIDHWTYLNFMTLKKIYKKQILFLTGKESCTL